MTIPAGDNWCPTCQEACHDHPRICTVCGTTLVAPPPRESSNSRGSRTDRLMEQIRDSNRILASLMERVQETMEMQRHVLDDLAHVREELQAEMMDPNNDQARSRPTARQTLETLPRIQLQSSNALFRQASLSFVVEGSDQNARLETMEAVPGEFGPGGSFGLENAVIIVAEPRTGKGGTLSEKTKLEIQNFTRAAEDESPAIILYLERGDGVTFVQKALFAQRAGAQAVVIGNNLAEPWPYVMRDSKNEAEMHNLTIPVVMVKQSDGRAISARCKTQPAACALNIQSQTKECVICTETFSVGQTVLRLPACGHVFHESCALRWLERHNTCPYCRRELPTDDVEYEQERRRTQRTHAGSQGASSSAYNEFYG